MNGNIDVYFGWVDLTQIGDGWRLAWLALSNRKIYPIGKAMELLDSGSTENEVLKVCASE
jgi:hypothetical protein